MMKRIDVDDESSLPIRASYRRFVIGIYVATTAAVNSKLWCLLSTPCKRGLNKHPRIHARRIYLRFYSVTYFLFFSCRFLYIRKAKGPGRYNNFNLFHEVLKFTTYEFKKWIFKFIFSLFGHKDVNLRQHEAVQCFLSGLFKVVFDPRVQLKEARDFESGEL